MKNSLSKNIKIAVRLAGTILLLGIVLFKTDFSELKGIMAQTKPIPVLGILLASLLSFWVKSKKMQYILKKLGCITKVSTLMATSMITTLYSLIMPGPLSSGVKWYILKKDTGQGTGVFSSMIYNQVTEFCVVIFFGLLGLIFVNLHSWKILILAIFVLITMSVVFISIAIIKDTKKIRAIISWPLRFLPKAIKSKFDSVLDNLHIFQKQNISFHFTALIFTVIGLLCAIAMYTLAAMAVNIEVPIAILVWQCALIYLLAKIPISVANLGVREFTIIEMLKTYNVEPSSALMMSMLLFANILFTAALGALCQIFYKFENDR